MASVKNKTRKRMRDENRNTNNYYDDKECPSSKKSKISTFNSPNIGHKDVVSIKDPRSFDIYKSLESNCFVEQYKCDYLYRLISALNYYASLNLSNGHDDEILIHFCVDIYNQILNDYIHVITTHCHELEEIYQHLLSYNEYGICDAMKCISLQRHYNSNIKYDNNDPLFMFYQQTFDSIHYYLYHLYDVGIRTKTIKDIENNDNNNNDINDKYDCIDHEFARKRKFIKEQHNKMGIMIDRFEDNTKYNITFGHGAVCNARNAEITFIDALFNHIKSNWCLIDINALYTFLYEQEYDTDTIIEDIDDDITDESNIINHIENQQFARFLRNYVKDAKMHSTSFSTGIIWYYWCHYKELQLCDVDEIDYTNINDHGGYDYKDLYVEQKYNNFKQEIVTHLNINDYNELVVLKVQKYIDTDRARSITANNYDYYLHYGISEGESITIQHLMSLIVYCDFGNISSEFSSTFRPIVAYETLSCIKTRNREFWWMSKLLRETVEIYGHNKREMSRRSECGPFFCGVSMVMNVPSFSIRLCSPTSTSKQLDVSINFATSDGMIIELNNDGHQYSDLLTMFDCCWISKYKEENERLFIGGWEKIRIQSIRVLDQDSKQWRNFEVFCHALFIFDSMVNGTIMHSNYGINITSKDVDIINKMVSLSLSVFNDYIVNCWEAFTKNKIQIVINMQYLYDYFNDGEINQFIVESLGGCDENKNLLSSVIFETFPNVKQLIIYTDDEENADYSYDFSLFKFLEIIIKSSTFSWKQIKIKSKRVEIEKEYKPSWIYKLWSIWSTKIKCAYIQQQLTIELTQEKTKLYGGLVEDCLVIQRL